MSPVGLLSWSWLQDASIAAGRVDSGFPRPWLRSTLVYAEHTHFRITVVPDTRLCVGLHISSASSETSVHACHTHTCTSRSTVWNTGPQMAHKSGHAKHCGVSKSKMLICQIQIEIICSEVYTLSGSMHQGQTSEASLKLWSVECPGHIQWLSLCITNGVHAGASSCAAFWRAGGGQGAAAGPQEPIRH